MEIKRAASLYSMFVGLSMMGMWVFLLAGGQVPEFQTVPVETAFSILADNTTAVMLLVGGYGLYTGRRWGFHAFLVSLGALFYSLMIAIGYYAQLGEPMFLGIFAPMFVFLVAFAYLSFARREEFEA